MTDIINEPTGKVYHRLLAYLEKNASSFSLVRRDQLDFSASADKLQNALRPFLIRQERTAKWPGSELIGHFAQVAFYRVTPEAVRVLANAPGLYTWLSPDYPEDLAFYRSDGTCLLASIAHEKDAWFEGDVQIHSVRAYVPGLNLKEYIE